MFEDTPLLYIQRLCTRGREPEVVVWFDKRHIAYSIERHKINRCLQVRLRHHRQHNQVAGLSGLKKLVACLQAGMPNLYELVGERQISAHQGIGIPLLFLLGSHALSLAYGMT